eukprot:5375422-Prymnesium_polylepis.1
MPIVCLPKRKLANWLTDSIPRCTTIAMLFPMRPKRIFSSFNRISLSGTLESGCASPSSAMSASSSSLPAER